VSEDVPPGAGGALAGFGPGSQISGYTLEEQAGAGGMAVVFRAHDERLDRRVALKILAPALAADQAFRQRFIRESRAAAAVDHPHIIPVFEAGESAGVLFIAMRYVRGGDVRSLLDELGPLPPARVAEIIAQVSSALDAAHDRGLVHRDVKPANMLLDSRATGGRPDHVYLSDFGLSKAALAATGLTGTGTFLGTVDYVSPEQIEGKPVDGRADQYALACAAFELLTGQPPFRRPEAMAVIFAQVSATPPTVTSLRPELPSAVDEVFTQALAKDPDDRFARCEDFAAALRAALGFAPYETGAVPAQTTRATPRQPTKVVRRAAGKTGPAATKAGAAPAGTSKMMVDPTRLNAAVTGAPAGPETEVLSNLAGVAARRRPTWRSPAVLGGAVVVLLAAGGGGAYLAGHKSSSSPDAATPPVVSSSAPPATASAAAAPLAALSAPGCSATAATGPALTASTTTVKLKYGNSYGIAVTRDGKYVFATNPLKLTTLVMKGDHTAGAQYGYLVASSGEAARGVALTSDGKYAAVAVGNQVNVQSATAAEGDSTTANRATLVVPGPAPVTDAVGVAISPDNKFAFVTLGKSSKLAVFNIGKALTTGQDQAGIYLGSVTLGLQPAGIAVSPDGLWVYVASAAKGHTAAFGPSQGEVSVLSVPKLETKPSSALVAQAAAGCSPTGVALSADGSTLWVTAQASNALLGFSTAKLRTDAAHALTADVPVGRRRPG
jgi:DNA-binding beta-propeller fold protein YncE